MRDEAPRLTALLAVHNRAERTEQCLALFFASCEAAGVHGRAYVLDDGSTDRTPDVLEAQPRDRVVVERGDGTLFWAASMARIEQRARAETDGPLLWLNDDVLLEPDAVATLMSLHHAHPEALLVGAVSDDQGEITYTGQRFVTHRLRRYFEPVLPDPAVPRPVVAANANILLVPHPVAQRLGGVDGQYSHAYADYDYTLRASKAGLPVLLAPGVLGRCEMNPVVGRHFDPDVPLRERIAFVRSRKGMPFRDQWRYTRAHGGRLWPLRFVLVYRRVLVPRRAQPR